MSNALLGLQAELYHYWKELEDEELRRRRNLAIHPGVLEYDPVRFAPSSWLTSDAEIVEGLSFVRSSSCGRTGARGDDCNSGMCSVCWKRRLFRQLARVIDARPERFVTLTEAGKAFDPDGTVLLVNNLIRSIRRDLGLKWECCWVIELTKAGVPHVHMLQKGDYLPLGDLQSIWGAICDIRKIRSVSQIKYISKYLVKDADVGYALNGFKFFHWTRGYMKLSGRSNDG